MLISIDIKNVREAVYQHYNGKPYYTMNDLDYYINKYSDYQVINSQYLESNDLRASRKTGVPYHKILNRNNVVAFRLPFIGVADTIEQIFELYDEYINNEKPYVLTIKNGGIGEKKFKESNLGFPHWKKKFSWWLDGRPYIGTDVKSVGTKLFYEFAEVERYKITKEEPVVICKEVSVPTPDMN